MKFWAQVNGGLRATADAWQNKAYQLRQYVFVRVQNTQDPASRQVVGIGPKPPGEPGGDQGGSAE